MRLRRILLLSLAGICLANCGVTQWQRDQDVMDAAVRDLNSPEMDKRIEQAKGTPAKAHI